MIDITGLSFAYRSGFRLNLEVLHAGAGERLAIIGPSGCGKTTLLNLIAGIELPQRGRVRFDDVDVNRLPDPERRRFRLRNIGFVFQSFELLSYLTARDNILYPCRLGAGRVDEASITRANDLAARVGLGDRLQRRPAALSYGEQQRVAICRALIGRPRLVLADEPTGNLDPDSKHSVLDLLVDTVAESNATLLMVTHDHDLLARFDRVVNLGSP